MRKGFFIVFVSLLYGCGSGQTLLPDSFDEIPHNENRSNPDASLNPTQNKSNDVPLENAVRLIRSDKFSGYLIVKLEGAKSLKVQGKSVVDKGSDPLGAEILNNSLRQLSKVRLATFKDRSKRWAALSGKSFQNLGSFVRIIIPDPQQAEKLMRDLWRQPGIETVYPGLKPALFDGDGEPDIPDLSTEQDYLESFESSGGLDAEVMWRPEEMGGGGTRGEGIKLLDVQFGWNRDHIDIPDSPMIWDTGSENAIATAHGTAVLGIVSGIDSDGTGIRGMAPGATIETDVGPIFVASSEDILSKYIDGEGDDDLEAGDIILLTIGWDLEAESCRDVTQGVAEEEGTLCQFPLEYFSDVSEIIKGIVTEGITVVESAGNAGINLNSTADPATDIYSFFSGAVNINEPDHNTEAILVGASNGAERIRPDWSNCGGRVDLFAWGEGVVTASYPNPDPDLDWGWEGTPPFDNNPEDADRYYTNVFGGTSSAGAMVAGAAALLQSYAKREMGETKFLTPKELKEILADSEVSPAADGGCPIGAQPRLDVAKTSFDDLWSGTQTAFSEIGVGGEISGARREELDTLGIGLICKLYDDENSDPSCPDTGRCVLREGASLEYVCDASGSNCSYTVSEPGEETVYGCRSPRCLPLDAEASDNDCLRGAIWLAGLRIGKSLDFDGDGRADLVNWTESSWQIDLTSRDDLGAWDLELSVPEIDARWVWPVAEDYNSDGRTDISVYDKENGIWYIKFTDRSVLEGIWSGWDWTITLPYQDELQMDVWETSYARPVPGDYDGDGFIDLALARSDGIWSIDHGGPSLSDYGVFDENITYLTPERLAEAPGWAYLPSNSIRGSTSYKIPDTVLGEGEWWVIDSTYGNYTFGGTFDLLGNFLGPDLVFGGNDSIPIRGRYSAPEVKRSDGSWLEMDDDEEELTLAFSEAMFGGLDCHPFVADFDGDNYDDRAVQCPTEFRIGLSSTGSLLTVPLSYNRNVFSLPGKPYFGSISYATTQRLIDYQRRSFPTRAPTIPVDMVQGGFCSLSWESGENPEECQ